MLAVRNFIMVARCSKCDFRNLGIIWDRNRWSEKKNVKKRIVEKSLVEKIFDRHFFDYNIYFRPLFFRPNFFGEKNRWKKIDKKSGSPISIPNFPKIPKIILRTACDRSKNTNSTHEGKILKKQSNPEKSLGIRYQLSGETLKWKYQKISKSYDLRGCTT